MSAVAHFRTASPSLASGHFMGDHWLASFALIALNSMNRLAAIIEKRD